MKLFEDKKKQYMAFREAFLATPTGRAMLWDLLMEVPHEMELAGADRLTIWMMAIQTFKRLGAIHQSTWDAFCAAIYALPYPDEDEPRGSRGPMLDD